MPGGYMGRILDIDLTNRTVKEFMPSDKILRQFIGGSGLGTHILYHQTSPATDPLGPDNLLILLTGPFTGTRVPTSGRLAVVTRSPLTGIFAESDVGGTWGTACKRAGFDGLVLRGRSHTPVYLWLNDGKVEFRDATHIWGMDTYTLDDVLKKETSPTATVLAIGPAGEKLVLLASIMTDGRHGRAAGRCGVGAVMGSKNLKAIVASGSFRVPVADEQGLTDSVRRILPEMVEKTRARNQFGTGNWVLTAEHTGDLPVRNWRGGEWEEGAEKISGQAMARTILTGRYYCHACPIGCGRVVQVKDGPFAGVDGAGPEYETLGMIGSNCLIDNLEAIALGHQLCNQYGLDVISVGGAVAFAMECYEHGLINREDAGGVDLSWGNPEALIQLIHQIGRREKLGALLGQGVKRAAEEIGGIASEFAIHVKGLELPAHDPRAMTSTAVSYATSSRGACHLQSLSYPLEVSLKMPEIGYNEPVDRFSNEGKGILAAKMQDLMSLLDSLKVCKFIVTGGGGVQPSKLVEWLNLVTGWDMTVAEFLTAGERIFNLKRLYSVRLGITRKDDTLPARILSWPRPDGGAAGSLPHLGKMLDEYYKYRGWDELGRPTREKLTLLGLA